MPVVSLPGNHDDPQFLTRFLDGDNMSYCRAVTLGDWRILPLDSRVAGRVAGHLDEAQLGLLDDELARPAAPHLLVFLHHHVLSVGSRWLDRIGLDNSEALLDRIAASDRVRGVFCGHVHQAHETMRGDTLIATTPSSCAQFKPDSEDFAVDTRPPAYRVLRLGASGELDTWVEWVAF